MPDGVTAFVTDPHGRVRPYDLDTGTRGEPLPALGTTKDPASALSASPDGRLLVQVARTRTDDGAITSTIGVFDATSRTLITGPIQVEGPIAPHAVFSAGDRTLLLARGPDAAVLRYDTATGAKLGELAAPPATPVDPFGPAPAAGGLEIADDRVIVGLALGQVRVVDPALISNTGTEPVAGRTTIRRREFRLPAPRS